MPPARQQKWDSPARPVLPREGHTSSLKTNIFTISVVFHFDPVKDKCPRPLSSALTGERGSVLATQEGRDQRAGRGHGQAGRKRCPCLGNLVDTGHSTSSTGKRLCPGDGVGGCRSSCPRPYPPPGLVPKLEGLGACPGANS